MSNELEQTPKHQSSLSFQVTPGRGHLELPFREQSKEKYVLYLRGPFDYQQNHSQRKKLFPIRL